MPRPRKSARLYFREREGRGAVWVIRDGSDEISTGCGAGDLQGAEKALQDYLGAKHKPEFHDGDPSRVLVADVLSLYGQERAPMTARPDVAAQAAPHLLEFFSGRTCRELTPGRCREYVTWRTKQPQARYKNQNTAPRVGSQTARRELEVLSAAIGYAHKEHKLLYPIPIALPDKAPPRDRWLTRDEAARLLRAAYRGEGKHVARFILLGLYTGTRHEAILRLRWIPSVDAGHVDLASGLIYRRGYGELETDKRRPSIAISRRLSAHLTRWAEEGGSHVVAYEGASILRLKRSWHTARKAAGLGPEVTPHILRHTFATWAVQAGKPFSWIASALGTSERMISQVYGHHRSTEQRDVVDAVSRGGRR